MLTGEDVSERFLSDINNHMERLSQTIDRNGITAEIMTIVAALKKDSNQVTATSKLNTNDVLAGSNKKTINPLPDTKKNQAVDPIEDAVQRLRFAVKQIYELINIAWSEGWEIKRIEDIINSSDFELVEDVTGITPEEWRKVLPAIDTTSLNRAIGQYNALQ
jgi:hypothetical protein